MYIILNVFSLKPRDSQGSSRDGYLRKQQTEYKSYIISIFEDQEFLDDSELFDFIARMKDEKKENLSYSDLVYRSFA